MSEHHCALCSEVARGDTMTDWYGYLYCSPCRASALACTDLGAAIAAFARRCEIADLDTAIRLGAFYIANPSHPAADSGESFRVALRRLVEIASEAAR